MTIEEERQTGKEFLAVLTGAVSNPSGAQFARLLSDERFSADLIPAKHRKALAEAIVAWAEWLRHVENVRSIQQLWEDAYGDKK